MFKQGCLSKEKQSFINTQQSLTSEFRSRAEEAALFAARRKQNVNYAGKNSGMVCMELSQRMGNDTGGAAESRVV